MEEAYDSILDKAQYLDDDTWKLLKDIRKKVQKQEDVPKTTVVEAANDEEDKSVIGMIEQAKAQTSSKVLAQRKHKYMFEHRQSYDSLLGDMCDFIQQTKAEREYVNAKILLSLKMRAANRGHSLSREESEERFNHKWYNAMKRRMLESHAKALLYYLGVDLSTGYKTLSNVELEKQVYAQIATELSEKAAAVRDMNNTIGLTCGEIDTVRKYKQIEEDDAKEYCPDSESDEDFEQDKIEDLEVFHNTVSICAGSEETCKRKCTNQCELCDDAGIKINTRAEYETWRIVLGNVGHVRNQMMAYENRMRKLQAGRTAKAAKTEARAAKAIAKAEARVKARAEATA